MLLKFFFLLTIYLHLYFYARALVCEPFGVHISLGSHYQSANTNQTDNLSENQTLNIIFQTKDLCPNISFAIIKGSNITILGSPNLTNFTFQSKNLTNQTKFIYNFTMNKEQTEIGEIRNYSIISYQNEANTIKNYSYKLPYRDIKENTTQKFVFVGMMDNSSSSQNTFTKLNKLASNNSVDMLIYLGDMAFNLQDDDYNKSDVFLSSLESFASFIPFMTTPGIRESNNNFEYYKSLFPMASDSKHGDFYSFNVGKVHLIQINMALFFIADSKNQTLLTGWLENDLAVASIRENRIVRPWVLIYGYYSFYCSYDGDSLCLQTNLKDNLLKMEKVFSKYKVDLYFSSHYPIYQRSKPIYQNITSVILSQINPDPNYLYMLNPETVIYIVEGVGGNNVTSIGTDKKSDNFLFNSTKEGYGVLSVINNTHLFYEHYGAINEEVIDQFYVINKLQKWEEPWTDQQEYLFVVSSVFFVCLGIILISLFQIYVDAVM